MFLTSLCYRLLPAFLSAPSAPSDDECANFFYLYPKITRPRPFDSLQKELQLPTKRGIEETFVAAFGRMVFFYWCVLSQHRWKGVHFELTTMIEVLWQKSVRFSRRLDWEAAEMSHFCIKSKELTGVPVVVVFTLLLLFYC